MTQQAWLRQAIELSRCCPVSASAYSVGAIVVGLHGGELARGYSRERTDPNVHAEEAALAKLPASAAVGATLYTSMEPCSERKSRQISCTGLIVAAGIRRVVFALREPPLFVDCQGAELLEQAGVDVVEVPDLADLVRDVNRELLGPR